MKNITQAVHTIKTGGIAIYPTDTAYAFGCRFNDTKAIRTIMRMKGRTDPKFTIIASSLGQVERFFKLTTAQRRLAKRYWPGPLSIVVSKKYAVRVPNNNIARSLARQSSTPLLATSVNISGQPAAYAIHDLIGTDLELPLKKHKVVIIDVGRLRQRKPSTVVECKGNQLIIHRHGPIVLPAT